MKLIIITGGSRGIGRSICKKYADEGYQVHDISRSGQSENTTLLDLADLESVLVTAPKLFSQLATKDLDEVLFFSNAGVTAPEGMTSEKNMRDVITNVNINVTSPIILMSEFVKAFQNVDCQKIIVNITSGAAESAMHGMSLYCSGKAGVENYVRVVAVEQQAQAHPIKAMNIDPGMVDTGMQAGVRATSDTDFPMAEMFRQFKKDGALRSADTVADVIETIISSDWENGSRHKVDDHF